MVSEIMDLRGDSIFVTVLNQYNPSLYSKDLSLHPQISVALPHHRKASFETDEDHYIKKKKTENIDW